MYNCGSHGSDLMNPKGQVTIRTLPPNCLAVHQRMDQGIFSGWKAMYRYWFIKKMLDHFSRLESEGKLIKMKLEVWRVWKWATILVCSTSPDSYTEARMMWSGLQLYIVGLGLIVLLQIWKRNATMSEVRRDASAWKRLLKSYSNCSLMCQSRIRNRFYLLRYMYHPERLWYCSLRSCGTVWLDT